jgi:hypothetical protein
MYAQPNLPLNGQKRSSQKKPANLTSIFIHHSLLMELIFRLSLGIAALVNLLPALLAIRPQNIAKSYGVSVPDGNYELLLRHRAVLFGIVWGLMLYSALTKVYYELATLIGQNHFLRIRRAMAGLPGIRSVCLPA